jgi:DNA-binding CsgD family transcriptional regulator
MLAALPHQAVLCGQYVVHAGGYAAVRRYSIGLPSGYLAHISCAGLNVRSPIVECLIRQGGPQFLKSGGHGDDRATVARAQAELSAWGWRNVLGLTHQEGAGDDLLLTTAAFYNVATGARQGVHALQAEWMPQLHKALKSARHAGAGLASPLELERAGSTRAESAVAELLRRGMTNKEIARQLGKSDQTVKNQVAKLLRKLGARNRTELVSLLGGSHRNGQPAVSGR